jgi:hypothetical protein
MDGNTAPGENPPTCANAEMSNGSSEAGAIASNGSSEAGAIASNGSSEAGAIASNGSSEAGAIASNGSSEAGAIASNSAIEAGANASAETNGASQTIVNGANASGVSNGTSDTCTPMTNQMCEEFADILQAMSEVSAYVQESSHLDRDLLDQLRGALTCVKDAMRALKNSQCAVMHVQVKIQRLLDVRCESLSTICEAMEQSKNVTNAGSRDGQDPGNAGSRDTHVRKASGSRNAHDPEDAGHSEDTARTREEAVLEHNRYREEYFEAQRELERAQKAFDEVQKDTLVKFRIAKEYMRQAREKIVENLDHASRERHEV